VACADGSRAEDLVDRLETGRTLVVGQVGTAVDAVAGSASVGGWDGRSFDGQAEYAAAEEARQNSDAGQLPVELVAAVAAVAAVGRWIVRRRNLVVVHAEKFGAAVASHCPASAAGSRALDDLAAHCEGAGLRRAQVVEEREAWVRAAPVHLEVDPTRAESCLLGESVGTRVWTAGLCFVAG
jgi:hypothetical protein